MLGRIDAPIELVEYGSYACPHCRAANERIAEVRAELGDRLLYVFRHRPLTGSDIARRAAELVERAPDQDAFWRAHVQLMTRSRELTEDDLRVVAEELAIPVGDAEAEAHTQARERVEADERSARASGVMVTPTFFINGRGYEGAWDTSSFAEAMVGTLGHRVRSAALDFARWAPSTGALLLVATVLAIALTNSPAGPAFVAMWEQPLGVSLGGTGLTMPLIEWVNDGLLSVFFLVVGLEIKRELTIGHLSSRRSAALPIAAALGGMIVPAGIYTLIVPDGPWSHGWGVPMATDTAFAVALIVMLGRRVPVELRIFLTAAAIVDDIGSIIVVALFYSSELHLESLAAAAVITALLAIIQRAGVYRVLPYAVLAMLLWGCLHAGGLHATLAAVLLAAFMPTRPPPNLHALMTQASAIIDEETHGGQVLRNRLSERALGALDAIHDRLESPAQRVLRNVEPWSSYLVLPVFALANAGVSLRGDVWAGHGPLMAAIAAGLVLGKPVGLVLASWLAVRSGLATKPTEYTWGQAWGAGALAGIGFTMSLFIAGQAFPEEATFAAAKIAVFAGSVISAAIGVAVLWRTATPDTPA